MNEATAASRMGNTQVATHLVKRVRDVLAERPTLPLPGHGRTLERWRQLAAFAAEDVCLAKILEAHYDAQAIQSDLGVSVSCGLAGVWAAEPPDARVAFSPARQTASGVKAWCSGMDMVDGALLTAHGPEGVQLLWLDLAAADVMRDATGWQAVGMSRVVSGRIVLDEAPAVPLGGPGDYLQRPGFWHGGAGIAACWYGAACAIAQTLAGSPRIGRDSHACAHLGAIDRVLASAAALLRQTAARIDAAPAQSHQHAVLQTRGTVERSCQEVIDRVGRALGPGPLCEDRDHARRCADLAVFVRQHHAERDDQALGGQTHTSGTAWTL